MAGSLVLGTGKALPLPRPMCAVVTNREAFLVVGPTLSIAEKHARVNSLLAPKCKPPQPLVARAVRVVAQDGTATVAVYVEGGVGPGVTGPTLAVVAARGRDLPIPFERNLAGTINWTKSSRDQQITEVIDRLSGSL